MSLDTLGKVGYVAGIQADSEVTKATDSLPLSVALQLLLTVGAAGLTRKFLAHGAHISATVLAGMAGIADLLDSGICQALKPRESRNKGSRRSETEGSSNKTNKPDVTTVVGEFGLKTALRSVAILSSGYAFSRLQDGFAKAFVIGIPTLAVCKDLDFALNN